jgi:hypothetical protein
MQYLETSSVSSEDKKFEWNAFLPIFHLHARETLFPTSIEQILRYSVLCKFHNGVLMQEEMHTPQKISQESRINPFWHDLSSSFLKVSEEEKKLLHQNPMWERSPVYVRVQENSTESVILRCMILFTGWQMKNCLCWSRVQPIHVKVFEQHLVHDSTTNTFQLKFVRFNDGNKEHSKIARDSVTNRPILSVSLRRHEFSTDIDARACKYWTPKVKQIYKDDEWTNILQFHKFRK